MFGLAVAMVAVALAGVGGYAALTSEDAPGAPGHAAPPSAVDSSGSAAVANPASVAGVPGAPEARTMLAGLPVKGRAPATGYERTGRFGKAWRDVDGNGCDTRDDILARDLSAVTTRDDCRVTSGALDDPYTGARIAFVRGEATSPLVQIDHVVALFDAWQTGAQTLSQEQRIQLANDPLNLVAVDGATNQAKGAGDAATWLPPNTGHRCVYVSRQIAVKAKYGLWVTPAERDALQGLLAAC